MTNTQNTVLSIEYTKTVQDFETETCTVFFDVDTGGELSGEYGVRHTADGDIFLVNDKGEVFISPYLLEALAALVTDHMLSA